MRLPSARQLFFFPLLFFYWTAAFAPALAKTAERPKKKVPAAAAPAPAAAALPKIFMVGRINGEASNELSVVNIRFDQKPNWPKVELEAHGSFLQLRLPQTIVTDPGSFYEGNSPYIEKIAVYQTKPDEVMIRLFTSAEASLVREAADTDILDNRLVITVDHRSMRAHQPEEVSAVASPPAAPPSSPTLPAQPASTAKPAATPVPAQTLLTVPASASADVATPQTLPSSVAPAALTAVPQNAEAPSPTPAASVHTNSKASAAQKSTPPPASQQLEGQLKNLAIFSLAFFILILAALTLRRLIRNQRILSTPESMIKMQRLSDLALAPKQKLSLIQVGRERLLISVSPDGVSLITHIQPEGPASTAMTPLRASASQPAELPPARHEAPSSASQLAAAQTGHSQRWAKTSSRAPTTRDGTTTTTSSSSSSPTGKMPATEAKGQLTEKRPAPKRIQYAIDDEGIQDRTLSAPPAPARDASTEKAIDDVTQLIREKLKSLPKIS